MRNKLSDLNNLLFECLERIMDDSLTAEELERELARSQALTGIAGTILHSGELSLKAARFQSEYLGRDVTLPPLIGSNDEN